MPGALMLLARAHAKLGQPLDRLNCLAEAAQITETTGERLLDPDVNRDALHGGSPRPTRYYCTKLYANQMIYV
jgi:hypothetical protein